jgi:adenylate cyclase class 2
VPLEQEIKLAFDQIEAARQAVIAAGGRLAVSRRLLDDRLFDTVTLDLRRAGKGLRVRRDADHAFLTFKGPVHASPVKAREELETTVGDASTAEVILRALGFRQVFRSQKYREEYAVGQAHVAIDDTPVGVFVEIEAAPDEIARVATALGRSPDDYLLESYPSLWRRWCEARALAQGDMLFATGDRRS